MDCQHNDELGRSPWMPNPDWTKHVPAEWPAESEMPPVPEEAAYADRREYGAAVHLRSRILRQWKRNFDRAARENLPQPDLEKYQIVQEYQKKVRQGKDRFGWKRRSRRRRHVKTKLRSGCSVAGRAWEKHAASQQHSQAEETEEKEEAGEPINLTRGDSEEEEAEPGTRRWLLEQCEVNQEVPWPADVQRLTKMKNPDRIRFDLRDVRQDECGCRERCEFATCKNAAESQVCEAETCTPGAEKCANRFRQQRLQLRMTRTGLGVVAGRAIPAGTVICPYWGQYTIRLRERDEDGRQVYVCAEEGGRWPDSLPTRVHPIPNFTRYGGDAVW